MSLAYQIFFNRFLKYLIYYYYYYIKSILLFGVSQCGLDMIVIYRNITYN